MPKKNWGKMKRIVPMKQSLSTMKDPVPLVEATRILRLRRLVVRRLMLTGKMSAVRIGAHYYIERREVERVALAKPWAPWAKRTTKAQ